jgi:hypothetical protein
MHAALFDRMPSGTQATCGEFEMTATRLISALAAVSFTVTVTASAATASIGSMGFTGRVLAPTEMLSISRHGELQPHRAAIEISSQRLTELKPVLETGDANLLEYFAGYAPASATLITAIYH